MRPCSRCGPRKGVDVFVACSTESWFSRRGTGVVQSQPAPHKTVLCTPVATRSLVPGHECPWRVGIAHTGVSRARCWLPGGQLVDLRAWLWLAAACLPGASPGAGCTLSLLVRPLHQHPPSKSPVCCAPISGWPVACCVLTSWSPSPHLCEELVPGARSRASCSPGEFHAGALISPAACSERECPVSGWGSGLPRCRVAVGWPATLQPELHPEPEQELSAPLSSHRFRSWGWGSTRPRWRAS